jgi:TonB family protein
VQTLGEGLTKAETSALNPSNRYLLVVPANQRPPITREALVNVNVSVNPNGKVRNVDVLDGSFTDTAINRLVENAVEDITFSPATQGGNPVRYDNLPLQVLLRGSNPPSTTAALGEGLGKLAEQVQGADYRGAERQVDTLLSRNSRTLFEMALLKDQLAGVYSNANRNPEALAASRIATARSPAVKAADAPAEAIFPDSFLPPEMYMDALRRHLVLAILTNQNGETLQVFDRLKEAAAAAGNAEVVDTIQPQIDQLQARLAAADPIGIAVNLVDNGAWTYTMSPRRSYGVMALDADNNGSIDDKETKAVNVQTIDISCGDSGTRRLPFQNDSEWSIPASWGQCDMTFRGKEGSQFLLIEYAN